MRRRRQGTEEERQIAKWQEEGMSFQDAKELWPKFRKDMTLAKRKYYLESYLEGKEWSRIQEQKKKEDIERRKVLDQRRMKDEDKKFAKERNLEFKDGWIDLGKQKKKVSAGSYKRGSEKRERRDKVWREKWRKELNK